MTRGADLTEDKMVVLCPPDCAQWRGSVFGTGIYASVSSVCGAAVHRWDTCCLSFPYLFSLFFLHPQASRQCSRFAKISCVKSTHPSCQLPIPGIFFLRVTALSNSTVICDEPGGDCCELLIKTTEENTTVHHSLPQGGDTHLAPIRSLKLLSTSSAGNKKSNLSQVQPVTLQVFLKGFSLSNAFYGLFICLIREIDAISGYSQLWTTGLMEVWFE